MSDKLELYELLQKADGLAHGEEKVRLLEDAVRLADQCWDLDGQFSIRLHLLKAGTFGGHAEVSYVAFAWCLSHYKEDPDRFSRHEYSFLWYFKNLLHASHHFPQITRTQMDEIADEMAFHYQRCGHNLRPYYYLQFWRALEFGDYDEAERLLPVWQDIPRDIMADCEACEGDGVAEFYSRTGQSRKALFHSKPNLTGERSCAEVPHRTFAKALRMCCEVGEYERAAEYHERGYPMLKDNPNFIPSWAQHLSYLVHIKNWEKAATLFQRHISDVAESLELGPKFRFYSVVAHFLKRIASEQSELRVNLPRTLPIFDPSHVYQCTELGEWFRRESLEIGQRFNERAHSDYYTTGYIDFLCY